MDHIPFECGSLDSILGGGVEAGCITLIYGEAGTGKTNLCMILSRNLAREGKKVVYIDTEGVSMERFHQVSGDDFDALVKNILVSEVHGFDEQEKMVEKAVKLAEANEEVGLIVVDSISMFYRALSRGDRSQRRSVGGQATSLLQAARKNRIPVVITSQVFTDVDTGTHEALGGHALHHTAKVILRLDRLGVGRRKALLMKHRHVPEGLAAEFRIVQNGIVC
ncbi:MAG: DNA repair and recombination protein RadB [Methanomassiliicoccales archaeon]